MKRTYVFDFYNLYIPKGRKYINNDLCIKIVPLKFAEEFEIHRTKFSKPYFRGDWKTAKCYITSQETEEAKIIVSWLEFIYSFAQGRNVFYYGYYEHKRGRKTMSYEAKYLPPTENRFPELIRGLYTRGGFYKRDISFFLDISLKTLSSAKPNELDEILSTIHAYMISKTPIVEELKFIVAWTAIEKLANNYYDKYKSKRENQLFAKVELALLKEDLKVVISEYLDKRLKGDRRLNNLKRNLTQNFLYDHSTLEKFNIYFKYKKLECDNILYKLEKMKKVRNKLAHKLKAEELTKDPHLINYLQRMLEDVIFRLLGIDKEMQKQFILIQYDR